MWGKQNVSCDCFCVTLLLGAFERAGHLKNPLRDLRSVVTMISMKQASLLVRPGDPDALLPWFYEARGNINDSLGLLNVHPGCAD